MQMGNKAWSESIRSVDDGHVKNPALQTTKDGAPGRDVLEAGAYARFDKTTKDGKGMSAATITQRTFPLAIVGYTQIPISVREQFHQYPHG